MLISSLWEDNFPGALCASPEIDPESFHSEDLLMQDITVTICGWCPHGPNGNDSCYEMAVRLDAQTGHAWGVWGGRTARERQLLLDAEDGSSG